MKTKKLTWKQAKRIVETNGTAEENSLYGKCSLYFQSQNYNNTGMTKEQIIRDVWNYGQKS